MTARAKILIGLTGNIATGKSAVLGMLRDLGAATIDADGMVHQLLEKGTPVWQDVVEGFGSGILQPDGQVDRARLGAIVFADPQALRRLEAIVHPAVTARTAELVHQAEERVVIVEAIKLIEAGMHRDCHALWVVTCPREQQITRLVEQRGLSRNEAVLRIDAQPPQEEKIALADVVIDNSGTLEETRQQVERAWYRLLNR